VTELGGTKRRTDVQRRQFVRHVRPWWESHHHRSPPLSAELVVRLHEQGPGPLALGIAAAADGAVLDAEGHVASRLFAMGPPLRGMWWESTAVTDVASQAKSLAARLTKK
jgi:uncharacterized NAD(P)/FAD-binding protein YdhS